MVATDLTMFDILGMLESDKSRGLAPTSIHSRRKDIHAFCQWMVDWELIPANPCSRIKPPRIPEHRKGFLSEADFQELLALCPVSTLLGARRHAMLQVFANTGMRRRELLMLTVDDLDWDRHLIRVLHGKGQKERTVLFPQPVQRAVHRYLAIRNSDRPQLWLSQVGTPLTHDTIGLDMRRLFIRAGLGHIEDCCHVFRRTAAANAEKSGIPRAYIQQLFGWNDSTMVDKYVAHMKGETEAIEVFRAKFKPFGSK